MPRLFASTSQLGWDQAIETGRRGEITDEAFGTRRRDVGHRLFHGGFGAAVDDHLGAGGGQALGDGKTNTGRRAGDDGLPA